MSPQTLFVGYKGLQFAQEVALAHLGGVEVWAFQRVTIMIGEGFERMWLLMTLEFDDSMLVDLLSVNIGVSFFM